MRYQDQKIFAETNEAAEVGKISFCKSKGDQQYEKIGCQGVILALKSFFSMPKVT